MEAINPIEVAQKTFETTRQNTMFGRILLKLVDGKESAARKTAEELLKLQNLDRAAKALCYYLIGKDTKDQQCRQAAVELASQLHQDLEAAQDNAMNDLVARSY